MNPPILVYGWLAGNIFRPTSQQPFDPSNEEYVSLATYRRNGVAVATPVWIAPHAGKHYVFSAGDAGKVKRLRANPAVRLAACNFRGELRSEAMDGRARILTDPAAMERARLALRAKYGLKMRLSDLGARLTGRMKRRAYIEIELPG